ncbi:MAG: tryptophan-rich sensory protein [Rhizobiaceae bacterium]|nr:tryptophan-rich sensory protein [Rhizobiaceae bacterium]
MKPASLPSLLTLLLFIGLAFGGGTLMGISFSAGEWYAGLTKPWFSPPNWLFGPAWTLLYILIGTAGWRVWQRGLARCLLLWIIQMALNFSWSPVFFGAHLTGLGLVVLIAMLASIIAFIFETWTKDRTAALLFMPYAAWVTFAGLLNGAIWWLN